MKLVMDIFLVLHIACGTLALLSAPVAIALRRTTPKHRIAGRLYFYSMLVVTATALVISVYKNIPFLFLVGVFSFYSIWVARRSLELKLLHTGQKAKWYDWVVGLVTFAFNIGLLAFGVLLLTQNKSMGWVAVVFGSIGIVTVVRSLLRFVKRPTDPKHWLYAHLQGMMAGYIATVTAFFAVNIHFLPGVVVWLSPTVIGTAAITYLMVRLKSGKEQF